jgi:hypothetical protein
MSALTDVEFLAALDDLAEYERRVIESDDLAQRDSLKFAATLASLQADHRWIEEWNAQRAETGKTARSRKPIEAENRSQFSTWVRQRYRKIDPRNTYRLLDAHMIVTSFIAGGNKTPLTEWQVRKERVQDQAWLRERRADQCLPRGRQPGRRATARQ